MSLQKNTNMQQLSGQQMNPKARPKSESQPHEHQQSYNKVYDECEPKSIAIFAIFKIVPLILYIILVFSSDNYILTFFMVGLLTSADFWNTKNISGRQLAALRWYSRRTEDNQQKFCFEASRTRIPAKINLLFFWILQVIAVFFWISIALLNIFTLNFSKVFLCLFCLIQLIVNFALFLQCKGDHQKKVNGIVKRFGIEFYELNEQK